jgi:hypothetical protein
MNTLTAAEFIHEYWYLIIAMIAIISMVSITVYNWFKLPNNEQIEQVKQWLLYAVAKAEKELGSGTGQIKLRYVYNMFIAKFPAIALFLTFEEFSNLVDEALQELQELIDKNIAKYNFILTKMNNNVI